MLGREIVEGQERVTIFREAGRLVVLWTVSLEEEIRGLLSALPCLGYPNCIQILLGARLSGLRELVEHIDGLVHQAALLAGLSVDLERGFPEAQVPVADVQIRASR